MLFDLGLPINNLWRILLCLCTDARRAKLISQQYYPTLRFFVYFISLFVSMFISRCFAVILIQEVRMTYMPFLKMAYDGK